MDKNAIKKYAIWARRELIARVSQRAALYEITADGYGNADAVSVHGRILSLEERNQRKALIAQIQQKGFEGNLGAGVLCADHRATRRSHGAWPGAARYSPDAQ